MPFPYIITAQEIGLSPNGKALKQYYDTLNIENLWLKGDRINWETGETIKRARILSLHIAVLL